MPNSEPVPSLDRAIEDFDSKFRYVLLASERAEQLVRGARPKLVHPGKPTRVAMEEARRGMIEWGYGPSEDPEETAADGDEAGGEEE